MRPRMQLALVAAIAGGVAAAAWHLYGPAATGDGGGGQGGGHQGGGRAGAVMAVVESLRLSPHVRTIRAVGTGLAVTSVMLYPDAEGRVTGVLFEAGDRVQAGQPLLTLDDADQQLAVRQAEAEVGVLQRRVGRFDRLADRGVASDVARDEARTALRIARLTLDRTRVALAERTLTAPFSGRIGIAAVDPGDRVDPGTAIAPLDDRSALFVDFMVPEDMIDRLSVGMAVPLTAWSRPEQPITGTVTALGSRIDPQTRRLRVRARVDNRDDRLRPGAAFAITLSVTGNRYPDLPEVAVLWNRDGSHVWRITDGKAERVFVRIVQRRGGRALVDGPLAAGDRIVVEGLQSMRAGRAVAHRAADPAAGS